MAHVYFHIDLNAFFANAEILLDPSLQGKPMIVSGQTRRSVVSTASYEARAYGIHSAMPVSEAEHLCKDLVVREPHFTWYRELSEKFMKIISSYTDEIEQASIDECYADVTIPIQRFARPLDLAWQIQQRVKKELGLPCSIGVGPNMFLAKMASDMKKPMGITVLRIREVPQKLWPLPISDMRGVGVRTLPAMEELGIHTIGDLANYKDLEALREIFGKNTEAMIARANGHDDRVIVKESESKSMGVSETFLEDITDYEEIRGMFRYLSRKLSERLIKEKKAGHSISVRIRYYDFSNADRSKKSDALLWKADDIFVEALSLFEKNWEQEPVRLIGISISDFADHTETSRQLNLFDPKLMQEAETDSILKDLNRELGTTAFIRAAEAVPREKQ